MLQVMNSACNLFIRNILVVIQIYDDNSQEVFKETFQNMLCLTSF